MAWGSLTVMGEFKSIVQIFELKSGDHGLHSAWAQLYCQKLLWQVEGTSLKNAMLPMLASDELVKTMAKATFHGGSFVLKSHCYKAFF